VLTCVFPAQRSAGWRLDNYYRDQAVTNAHQLADLLSSADASVVSDRLKRSAPCAEKHRGADAGISDLHPHVFRHTWAHAFRAAGDDDRSTPLRGNA
jgi:hypothetical protein